MATTIVKPLYCAIYTRKSTNEGLDQDFTTLDNQREAAENYVVSQKSEGWTVLPDRYDDGGYTGANIDRPALQRLIADIKENKINCVVVYKVDRLSRSLLDFVQLLELFEKYNVTFISVTQAFNTNSSMGRLTLNILLSFAQFEREIISERVKDKMGAARKKGRWLGGRPILGYEVDKANHKLVVNEKDAKIVREIFDLYLKEKSLMSVAKILNEKGYRTKQYTSKAGITYGGIKFKTTNIHLILNNVLYIGKVKYGGELYPGMQEAIISDEIFNKVQAILANNTIERQKPEKSKNAGLLSGILRCKTCDCAMSYTYTKKGERKYQYYACMNAKKRGYANCPTRSVNAQHIENAVIVSLIKIAADSDMRKEALNDVNKQIRQEIETHSKETKALIEKMRNLPTKHAEYDHLLTEARLKEMSLGQKLITDQELEQALIVRSPIWDTLFPQEKHKALKLILKEASYNATDAKLSLTLNHNGIKFLYLLLHPRFQKDLK